MNNQDNYKKALDEIHATEELKEKTIKKIKDSRKQKKIVYLKFLSACAVFVLVFATGKMYFEQNTATNILPIVPNENPVNLENNENNMTKINSNLPRFKSMEELKEALNNNRSSDRFLTNDLTAKGEVLEDIAYTESANKETTTTSNYSTTNVQVKGVDEADIVKTDGKYIYYVTGNVVYIIKANDLEIVKELDLKSDKEEFYPSELYINNDKLIILGNSREYRQEEDLIVVEYRSMIRTNNMAEAIVYDISNKTNPKLVRTVKLDGNYINSRMIGENIYLISSKSAYYYNQVIDDQILPKIYDTKAGESRIAVTDIAYFPNTNSYSFMTVAGFDINNEKAVCTETFFGASDDIYASQNHLYITQTVYESGWYRSDSAKNIIYKFKLDGPNIKLLCKGEVKGTINNQFSMDEYNGNLRVATTLGYDKNAKNQLYILDENLKEISKIEDLAVGEKIYSVRFIGKIGYIVTFEQIDPLFVIDLSDPKNPTIKGELKIPGYSSYLHPYDETHIIGIGYNTKSNGYGGVTNSNMKMSMFDVSNLEDPKEIFHVDIGNNYTDSNVLYNHKILFENKEKNLIGFPVTFREYNANKDRAGFVIYHIDLENGFEKYGEITSKIDYRTDIDRAIYIGNTLYTLAEQEIKSYNLETLDHIKTLTLEDFDYYDIEDYEEEYDDEDYDEDEDFEDDYYEEDDDDEDEHSFIYNIFKNILN